jgi:hypothetical protein
VGLGLLAHGLANPDVKELAGKLRRSRNGTGEERSAGLEETAHRHQLEDAYQPVS